MNKFDPTKPCTTRDGKEVKIYEVYPGQGMIHGAYKADDGKFYSASWNIEGIEYYGYNGGRIDLINPTVKHEGWINIYPNCKEVFGSEIHPSRGIADLHADNATRTACIKITWEDGEGL